MSQKDRIRWDNRYGEKTPVSLSGGFPLPLFAAHAGSFPTQGSAMDIACGRGEAAVWFALRGMNTYGVDVSHSAIEQARELSGSNGVSARSRFDVCDLDNGLPESEPVDLLICHNFRKPDLYTAMESRLSSGGLLAIVVLSEVGASTGRFRAKAGELAASFSGLDKLCGGEGEGRAWLLARKV